MLVSRQLHPNNTYTLWLFNIAMENQFFFIGKPSVNGSFSMAMLKNQRVDQTAMA
jgi:hypothetical protein